ncbi:MAG: hypothetical protein M3458_21855 [Acidobacteriota bacterium]|nr:hypothetical protein [Acidobacteriota bacterium]
MIRLLKICFVCLLLFVLVVPPWHTSASGQAPPFGFPSLSFNPHQHQTSKRQSQAAPQASSTPRGNAVVTVTSASEVKPASTFEIKPLVESEEVADAPHVTTVPFAPFAPVTASFVPSQPVVVPVADAPTVPKLPVPAKPQTVSEGKLARWIDLQALTFTTRYRFVENSANVTTTNQAQYQNVLKGAFKFDEQGKYTVNAGVFTGKGFTNSWNNTSIGTGDLVTIHYLKQLYFAAKPVKGLEIQIGGLYIARGESTEATTYDNDGYITGQRVSVKRPKNFYFDEVSVTYGYLGDLTKPNLFRRLHRLNESNYHQFLVAKKFGKRVSFSGDYTFQSGTEYLRQAVKVDTRKLFAALDSFRFETYQRLDVNPNFGFNLNGEKTFLKNLTLGAGYARIDRDYHGLNGDRFNRGSRVYATGSYALSPDFTLSAFVGRGVNNDYAIPNKTRVDVLFTYNLSNALKRRKIF